MDLMQTLNNKNQELFTFIAEDISKNDMKYQSKSLNESLCSFNLFEYNIL